MILKFFLKAVVAPFVSQIAGKAGEAYGEKLAHSINPPDFACQACEQTHVDPGTHICPGAPDDDEDEDTEDEAESSD